MDVAFSIKYALLLVATLTSFCKLKKPQCLYIISLNIFLCIYFSVYISSYIFSVCIYYDRNNYSSATVILKNVHFPIYCTYI